MNVKDQVVKYKGTYYIVTSEGVGTYTVYPQGGGFQGRIPKEGCELVDTIPTDMREGFAFIDDPELSTYPCTYNHNHFWNGWRDPSFKEEIIEKMLGHWKVETTEKDTEKGIWKFRFRDDDEQEIHLGKDGNWSFDGYCWSVLEDLDAEGDEEIMERNEMMKGIVEPYCCMDEG